MTDGHAPPSPQTTGDGSPPFDPFVLEPQKARSSTGAAGPGSVEHGGSRGFRIPPAFLGLVLALAVAVPVVVGTLPQSGQAPSDPGAAPSLEQETPSEPADPAPPPPISREAPEEAPPPPPEPEAADPDSRQLLAVQDCAASLPGLRTNCEIVLGNNAETAARYLDCRDAGVAAARCLEVVPAD
jgi:hypothetical protein